MDTCRLLLAAKLYRQAVRGTSCSRPGSWLDSANAACIAESMFDSSPDSMTRPKARTAGRARA